MAKQTPVINMTGDYEESITRLAKHLGSDKIRRKIFDEIYGRARKLRSKKQIMAAAGIPDKGNNEQQVQNALKHLSKYNLITKHDNDGHTNDGARLVYGKDDSVGAHKEIIRKYADNPRLAAKVPTKRSIPATQSTSTVRKITKRELKKKKHLNVLYLTANPIKEDQLRIGAEIQQVQNAIRGSKYRDNVTVQFRPAANLQTLLDGLNDFRPQIVHFSGHGNEHGLATDVGGIDGAKVKALSFETLAKAIGATTNPPEIVVLSACKSSGAKKALLPPAKILISMKESVSDVAAATFSVQLYAALAGGQHVKAAFEQAQILVEAVSLDECDTPQLFAAAGTDPAKMILA